MNPIPPSSPHSQPRPVGSRADARQRLARAIESTQLTFQPGEEPPKAIQTLCEDAKRYNFLGVCVRPEHLEWARQALADSPVRLVTVIGFPKEKTDLEMEKKHPTVGDAPLAEKLDEVAKSVKAGADELDLVLNVRQFKVETNHAQYPRTVHELQTVMEKAATEAKTHATERKDRPEPGRPLVKVIIETDLLSDPEIEAATRCCAEAGVGFVKTSTGMLHGGQGATVHAVGVIKRQLDALKASLGIKASGGIQTADQAEDLLDTGATRLGTSKGVKIMQERQDD